MDGPLPLPKRAGTAAPPALVRVLPVCVLLVSVTGRSPPKVPGPRQREGEQDGRTKRSRNGGKEQREEFNDKLEYDCSGIDAWGSTQRQMVIQRIALGR